MTDIMNTAVVNYSFSGSSEAYSETSNTSTVRLKDLNSLTVVKNCQSSTFTPGDTVTYVITITNSGTSYFSGVRITDDLSNKGYLTYVSGSALLYYGGRALAPQIASTNPLVFTLSPLTAGQSMVLTYTCRVPWNLSPSVNEITNTVKGIGYTYNSTAEDTDTCTITKAQSANLSIRKEASASAVAVGETFAYTITLSNSGSNQANVSSIQDSFPSNYEITSVSLKVGSGTTTVLSPSDYTIDSSNMLTVPSSTGPTISVPSASGGVLGTTILTIGGHFTGV